jgi:hypothetical protein
MGNKVVAEPEKPARGTQTIKITKNKLFKKSKSENKKETSKEA